MMLTSQKEWAQSQKKKQFEVCQLLKRKEQLCLAEVLRFWLHPFMPVFSTLQGPCRVSVRGRTCVSAPAWWFLSTGGLFRKPKPSRAAEMMNPTSPERVRKELLKANSSNGCFKSKPTCAPICIVK